MRRRLPLLLPPPSRAPFSCARFGDDRSATVDCGGAAAAAAACCACLARMNSTILLALRRCREFGRLGEHLVVLCAVSGLASAVRPADARLASPAFSPAVDCALSVRVVPCLPSPRRGRWMSGDRARVVGGRCAIAALPPAACRSCSALGFAMVCAEPVRASWNLKVSFTPWSSTEYNPPSAPSLPARRISFHCCLPSRIRPGSLGVPAACTPRLAEPSSDILNFSTSQRHGER